MTINEQIAYLTKGAEETIREEDLYAKLEQAEKTGKKLRVYLGVDPTAPDIHLGHTVVLRKLKHFQELGHTAIFLIGDFSALIGDPTGQSETRPPLAREDVEANARTYLQQVYKILDREKTEVRYNSEWLGKMSSYDVVRLCGHYRLARMLEREDFRSRLNKNLPISVHELLYPLLTAYDAVMLKSDVELGATEQKFNLLVHREIQREYGLSPQVILTMPILEGLDGVKKMSKSLGNYVGINEAPAEIFGKLMSISDEMMWRYYDLVTDLPPKEIADLKQSVTAGTVHPLEVKKSLAVRIVSDFHGAEEAALAQENFQAKHEGKGIDATAPSAVSEILPGCQFRVKVGPRERVFQVGSRLDDWLVSLGLCGSKREAQRLIKAGAVSLAVVEPGVPNWIRITSPTYEFNPYHYRGPGNSTEIAVKVGPRRQHRITFNFPD